MRTRNLLLSVALTLAFGSAALAETPGLGKTITEAETKAWDIAVLPDGTNMPPGSGTPTQGAEVYAQKCAMCHGEKGANPRPGYSPMIGAHKFEKIDSPKTVTYYEFATTLFDVIRRSMPFQMPRTLTDNEVYAVSAYILSLNKLIGENDVMNAETLPKVKMPNAGKFIIPYPDRI
jgi:S-disulfanyl-L-cysteine oxidoreductase SoxD